MNHYHAIGILYLDCSGLTSEIVHIPFSLREAVDEDRLIRIAAKLCGASDMEYLNVEEVEAA